MVPGVVVFIEEGLHVPVTPLGDVVAKAGAVVPWQIAAIGAKLGVTLELTATIAEPFTVPVQLASVTEVSV